MYRLISLIIVSLFFFNSCQKEEPINNCSDSTSDKTTLVLYFNTLVKNEQFVLNDSLYDDYLDRKYRVELLKFYLSNILLEREDGLLDSISDVFLVDHASDDPFLIETIIDTGKYVSIHFGVGLDSLMNASDPSNFQSSHPLSIAQNTYWNWASKYKFFMLEGRVDTIDALSPDFIFSYHSGFDDLYRQISLPLDQFNATTDPFSLFLELDLSIVLNSHAGVVDFVEQPFSHSQNDFDIVETISNNITSAFSVSY